MANAWIISGSRAGLGSATITNAGSSTVQTLAQLGAVQSTIVSPAAPAVTYRMYVLSAERAGLASVVDIDAGDLKTQALSNIGFVVSKAPVSGVFIIHPFV